MPTEDDTTPTISIGALSRATGVAVETLRTWERRYGFPRPIRLPSGHRRYRPEAVERLRLVRRALDFGHRPSTVVGAEPEELRKLLMLSETSRSETSTEGRDARADGPIIEEWIRLIDRMDSIGLERSLKHAWLQRGAKSFVSDLGIPLLRQLGERWRSGKTSVAHEHFASERLRDFLAEQWRPLSSAARGPRVVCATMPGERHSLPLHLAAIVLTLADVRVVFLGADAPIEDIAHTVTSEQAAALVLAVSLAADESIVADQIARLRGQIPETTAIAVGGPPYLADVAGITAMDCFEDLDPWANQLRSIHVANNGHR